MAVTSGADADALDQLAARLDAGADRIDAIYAPVRQAFLASQWLGMDADAFGTEWDGPSRSRLVQSVAKLREGADTLRLNAQQQRIASDEVSAVGRGRTMGSGGIGIGPNAESGQDWRLFDAAVDFAGIGDLIYTVMQLSDNVPKDLTKIGSFGKLGKGVPGIGLLLGAAGIASAVAQHGPWSGEALDAYVDAGIGLLPFPFSTAYWIGHDLIGPQVYSGLDWATTELTGKSFVDNQYDTYVERVYGVTDLDSVDTGERFRITNEVSERYEGPMGFAHYASDSVYNAFYFVGKKEHEFVDWIFGK